MGETFMQKAADGSVWQLWHHFTQTVQIMKVSDQWSNQYNAKKGRNQLIFLGVQNDATCCCT